MRYNGTYHLIGAFSIALLVVLGVLMGGCSNKEESTSTKPKPTTKPTQVAAVPTKAPTAKVEVPSKQVKKEEPTKPAPATKADDLLKKIANEKDLFALYDMKTQYEKGTDKADSVLSAFVKKQDELIAQQKRKPAIDGCLDFASFDFRRVNDQQCQLRWYFIVTEDISQDWIFKSAMWIDKKELNPLVKGDQARDGITFRIGPKELNIRGWKKGDHRVLTHIADIKPIPYRISSFFYQWFPDGKPDVRANSIQGGELYICKDQ